MQSVMLTSTVLLTRQQLPAPDDAIGWLQDYGLCLAGSQGGSWRVAAISAPASGMRTWEHWRNVRTIKTVNLPRPTGH